MPRPPSPEVLREIEEFRAFMRALFDALATVGEVNAEFAEGMKAAVTQSRGESPSRIRSGLRMALGDVLEMTRDLPAGAVRTLDAHLAGAGVVTLTAMRERIWALLPKIMARGRIRTRAEYDLVNERLIDTTESGFAKEEREKAATMIAAFEDAEVAKAQRRRKPRGNGG